MRLDDWRRSQNLTLEALGDLLQVSNQAVSRYCHGRVPTPPVVLRVYRITCGAVEPNDFYDLTAVDMSGCKPLPAPLKPDALVASGVQT